MNHASMGFLTKLPVVKTNTPSMCVGTNLCLVMNFTAGGHEKDYPSGLLTAIYLTASEFRFTISSDVRTGIPADDLLLAGP